MTTTEAPAGAGPEAPMAFQTRQRVGWQAAGFLAGGFLILLFVIGVFLAMLLAPTRPGSSLDIMPGILGGVSVLWIGMLLRGVFLLRSVVRVVVGGETVSLEGFIARNAIPWDRIDRVERAKRNQLLGGKTYHVLRLRGEGDKPLGEIPDTIDGFEPLAALIADRSAAARGRVTYDPAGDEQRRATKEAKTLRWASIGLGFFTLAMAAGFVAGLNEEYHLRQYATAGVRTDAKIERHFMRRVTPVLEYSFVDAAGATHRREVMMEQRAWDALLGAATVPVEYLPSSPSWNRPVAGVDEVSFGGPFLLITGIGILFFGVCFALAVSGFDMNTENGVTTITRRGRVIRTFGKPTAAVATTPHLLQPIPTILPPPAFAPPLPTSHQPPTVAPPGKPKGLLALGIVCIVLGTLGLLFGGLRLVIVPILAARVEERLGPTEIPGWAIYWHSADALLAAALLVTGIGLLKLKRWSRQLGLAVGALQILSGLGSIAAAVWSAQTWETADPRDSMIPIVAVAGAVIWHLLGMILPTVLFIVLSRRGTREALVE